MHGIIDNLNEPAGDVGAKTWQALKLPFEQDKPYPQNIIRGEQTARSYLNPMIEEMYVRNIWSQWSYQDFLLEKNIISRLCKDIIENITTMLADEIEELMHNSKVIKAIMQLSKEDIRGAVITTALEGVLKRFRDVAKTTTSVLNWLYANEIENHLKIVTSPLRYVIDPETSNYCGYQQGFLIQIALETGNLVADYGKAMSNPNEAYSSTDSAMDYLIEVAYLNLSSGYRNKQLDALNLYVPPDIVQMII